MQDTLFSVWEATPFAYFLSFCLIAECAGLDVTFPFHQQPFLFVPHWMCRNIVPHWMCQTLGLPSFAAVGVSARELTGEDDG